MFYSGSDTVSESIEVLQWTLEMQPLHDLRELIPSDRYKILELNMYISVAGGSQDVTYSSLELKNFGKRSEYSEYRK